MKSRLLARKMPCTKEETKADKNTYDKLDREEAKSHPRVSKSFDTIDVDKNGTVDRDEVHNFMKEKHQH